MRIRKCVIIVVNFNLFLDKNPHKEEVMELFFICDIADENEFCFSQPIDVKKEVYY